MHMRDQEERRFAVSIKHDKNYQFLSQASEDGRVHGGPFRSDEPDPVGDDAGPATPALLGAAVGHCLSASLLETLKRSRLDVCAFETEAVAVVKPNAEGLPRIDHVDVVLKPVLSARSPRTVRAEEVFENHCTVTSSVKRGIDVRVRVEWMYKEQPADATA
jgi:organic hydroperoxide reductase OsmC/OhrA